MRARVLGDAEGEQGLSVELTSTLATGLNDGSEVAARAGSRAYRAVPLLRVLGNSGARTIVVGQARISVGAEATVSLALQAAWSEQDGWAPVAVTSLDLARLGEALARPGHTVPAPGRSTASRQHTAAVLAKGLTEGSRNAVAELRAVRYGLEERLAEGLRTKQGRTGLLSQIVEIALSVNRARDQAREAAREGMWLWLTDDVAYQRHRKAMNGSMISSVTAADAATRPWMRIHDAGVRQCAGMEALLGEEARLLYDLLGGASTVEASREADAQESLNQLLTVAGVGLGVPALLLTFYGVDGLTPPDNATRLGAIAFIALVTVGGGLVAVTHGPALASMSRKRAAVTSLAVLILLLVVAGLLAPPR